MSLRVMVIGAGLGGLTLANGLSRAGVEVVVERGSRWSCTSATPMPEARAQGARFHIDDRGVRVLRACLPAEQFEFFRATVGRPSESLCEVGEVDGRWAILGRHQFSGAQGVPDSVRPGWPASRQLLRRTLLSGMDGHVWFDKELLRYELPPAGGVRAYFADGSTDSKDVLVGADGIGSVVRGQYLPHARVVDTWYAPDWCRASGSAADRGPGLAGTDLLAAGGHWRASRAVAAEGGHAAWRRHSRHAAEPRLGGQHRAAGRPQARGQPDRGQSRAARAAASHR